jgi:predicted dehydrogenase
MATVARLGFIGAGWWATANHMPLLAARPDVELRAVCRLGEAELQRVKEAFDFPYATQEYRTLLDQVELDAVIISTPHTRHYEHARAALERGLHVMCEKPMCLRAEEARELVRLARDRGRHLLVPYGWHYKPFIQEAKRQMDQGAIGPVQYVLCHMASPIRKMLRGQRFLQEIPGGQAGDMLFEPDPATWADPDVAGGGYGHAQLSHSTGMLFWLTSLRAREVYALMTAPEARVDLYDALAVSFEGGSIGTISGAGTVPEDRPFHVDLRLFGADGMLLLDCERARMEVRRHDGRHHVVDVAPDAGGYACDGPPHNFVDLVLGKTDVNWAPGEVAMRSVELLDAAYRSARSGRPELV